MGADAAVRPEAVAGTFYPADPDRLRGDVRAHVGAAVEGPRPRALVVPHAGYVYSGSTAGEGYRRLLPWADTYDRVILLGPAHRVPLRGLAVPTVDAFATPLGPVAVAADARDALAGLAAVVADDRPHRDEHALEVHLPFVLEVLGRVRVLPVVVGEADAGAVAEVLDRLWDDATLVVVSSDLSHYLDHESAVRRDEATCAVVEAGGRRPIEPTEACGARPLNGLLLAARRRGLAVHRVARRTSADTAGPPDRVVGYAAFVLADADSGPEPDRRGEREPLLGAQDCARLLDAASVAVTTAVRTGTPPAVDLDAAPDVLRAPGASFVTLERNGRLLGCIGSLEPRRALLADVVDNALGAAFRDPRLPPVTADDLPELTVKVSVLSPLEPVAADSEADLLARLRPGVDGVLLSAGGRRATFLPAVWASLPDPAAFWRHLLAKAGLPPGAWPAGAQVWRYTAQEAVRPPEVVDGPR